MVCTQRAGEVITFRGIQSSVPYYWQSAALPEKGTKVEVVSNNSLRPPVIKGTFIGDRFNDHKIRVLLASGAEIELTPDKDTAVKMEILD